jgi:hypothetical protein
MRRKNLGRLLPPRKKQDRRLQDETATYTDAVETFIASEAPVPRKFGFAASAVTFADSVEPETIDVFLKCEFLVLPRTPYLIFTSVSSLAHCSQ